MTLIELKNRQDVANDHKLSKLYTQFGELLNELKKRELPEQVILTINACVEQVNSSSLSAKELKKLVKQQQASVLKLVQKELNLVPKNYYQTLGIALGMSGLGVPMGVAFGLSMGNMGLLGLGLPIGLGLGVAIGSRLDKKALNEGRQLNVEVK